MLEILIQNGSGISLSIFRSIRLLRIFKLVRPVRYQLLVMVHTMTSVITFFALLFLFMFAFAILGMNLFGGKFRFPGEDGHIVNERSNFDNFLWAMITVFQVKYRLQFLKLPGAYKTYFGWRRKKGEDFKKSFQSFFQFV